MTRMPARLALSLALVAGAVVATAAPSSASDDSCAAPTALGSASVTAHGTVGRFDTSDWFAHTATAPLPPRVVTLVPVDGGADLYVYSACGGVLLCASTNPGLAPETCLPPVAAAGPVVVEVRHDTAASSGTNYALTVDAGNCLTRSRVSAGVTTSVVVPGTDGVAYEWGGTSSGALRPLPAATVGDVTSVAAGRDRTVALRADATVWTWARDEAPVPVGVEGATAIAAGDGYALAVRADGTVWAWGRNEYGQLGDGTTEPRDVPAMVGDLTGVASVVAGARHALALRCDGTVFAWGRNASGQLGDGTTVTRTTPVPVAGLTGVVALAAGGDHSLAIRADGTAWAWGANASGQLGDGTTTARRTPAVVSGGGRYTAVAGGSTHSVALRADGTVWAWGGNASGQLGDGTTLQRATPAQVPGLSGVRDIGAGTSHTLGVRFDATVLAWGGNEYGQLGDGGLVPFRTVPLPAPIPPLNVDAPVVVGPVVVPPLGP